MQSETDEKEVYENTEKRSETSEKPKTKENKIYIFNKPKTILVIGKKGSGKSNLIRNLLLKNCVDHKYFNFGIVFT